MAKIVGLVGSGHGKLGNTVMTVRRGVQIARVYQPVVANPKSARQQFSRAKMRFSVGLLRPYLKALVAGWNLSKPSYEFQKGLSVVIPEGNRILTFDDAEMKFVVEKLNFTKALSAPLLEPISADSLNFGAEAQVVFKVLTNQSHFEDDKGNPIALGAVVVIAVDGAPEVVTAFQPITYRAEGSPVTVTVPARWSGTPVDVYCFVKQIPEGINGIPSEDYPWRFPAKTSAALYVGHGEIS